MYSDKLLLPNWRTPDVAAIREGVGHGLLLIGDDPRVLVLTADLASSTKVDLFRDKYPDRFVEVGVAEQNMAGVAAGLSMINYIPFIASYASFSPGRNWEQIRVSIALSKANVKIIGSHAGVSVGVNGPSHMGTEDIALMRILPNMTVVVPADFNECRSAIVAAYRHQGPVYIRTTRPKTPVFLKENDFEIGKAKVLREGNDLSIAACGIQVYTGLMVAEDLGKIGINCEVLNISSIKPLDKRVIIESVKKTKKIVTIEDHQVAGGLGSSIAEMLSLELPTRMLQVGINDRFGISGEWKQVYKIMGLDYKDITKAVIDYINGKI